MPNGTPDDPAPALPPALVLSEPIGKYFAWGELVESQAARRRPDVWAQQAAPPRIVRANLTQLVSLTLDPLRAALGAPLTISSGYRCPELNVLVNGADASAHMKGRAADLKAWPWLAIDAVASATRAQLFAEAVAGGRLESRAPTSANGWLWLAVVVWAHALKIDKAIHEFGDPCAPAWVHVQVSDVVGDAEPRGMFLIHDPARGRYYERLTREEALSL